MTAPHATTFFDLTGRAQIELTGSDRAKFLHNFCTNDIKRLGEGGGCEAFVTNIKGRVLGHIFVFATADSLWIDSVPGADETLIAHLDRYLITEDVVLNSRTEEFGEFFLTGPSAVDALAKMGIDAESLGLNGHSVLGAGETFVTVRRVDWLNEPDFLMLVACDKLENARSALTAAGILESNPETFDALRIESGFPLYGCDISDENLAQEVGRTQQAISFTKGCYLGQEPIARLDAMGHVNRQLCGLKLASGPVPQRDSVIVADGGETEIGRV
ncbi:MAG: folate-binding protein YgfZ, partial [Planctomycetaceae bacterium]|nr:folate-binding protein YgfZ [Planctomycetaceae bacterium]